LEIMLIVGGVLHAAILLLPLIATGHAAAAIADPAIQLFLLLATAFYLGDAAAVEDRGRTARPRSFPPNFRPSQTQTLRLALVTGASVLAIFWIGLVCRAAAGGTGIGRMQVVGATAMLGGTALRHAAIRRLGRLFVSEVVVAPDQDLVTGGVYRWLRHPSETGTLFVALGASLCLESAAALALCCVGLLPLVALRVRREDRVLRAAFGEAYRAYAARTGGILPLRRPRARGLEGREKTAQARCLPPRSPSG
jgi:protein-S-isoprenylcysteine O-methyltransferase Ste14